MHNETDGTVEIMMRGEEEKIDRMILACQKGPMFARVDKLEFVVGRWSGFLPPDRRRGFQTLLNRGGLCTP